MPVATYQHCIICYKEQKPTLPPPGPGSRVINRNAEICRRFCTLASRHLDLDPYFYQWEKTLKSKSMINIETVCDECLEPASSFCDIYGQLEYLQMQLSWRLMEVCRLMTNADKEDSPNVAYREKLKDKVDAFGVTAMKDIEEFRGEFLEAVEVKRKNFYPRVVSQKMDGNGGGGAPKVQISDDEESLFVECTPAKQKKTEEVKVKVEEVKRRGRPKKVTPSPPAAHLPLTPPPSAPVPISPPKKNSKKRPISPAPRLVKIELTEKKRPAVSAKVAANKAPKFKAMKVIPTAGPKSKKKIEPAPKEEITYFEIDSNSGSDDLFEPVKPLKKKPPISKKAKMKINLNLKDLGEDELYPEEDDDEEEKVAVFSEPGHKINEKDRVPRDLNSYVIGWLNRGK